MIASQGLLDILAPLGSKAPLPEIRRISLAWKERRMNGPSGKEEATKNTRRNWITFSGTEKWRLGAIDWLAGKNGTEMGRAISSLGQDGGRPARNLRRRRGHRPLWLEAIEARLATLALWPEAAPWRAGVTALIPSLSRTRGTGPC